MNKYSMHAEKYFFCMFFLMGEKKCSFLTFGCLPRPPKQSLASCFKATVSDLINKRKLCYFNHKHNYCKILFICIIYVHTTFISNSTGILQASPQISTSSMSVISIKKSYSSFYSRMLQFGSPPEIINSKLKEVFMKMALPHTFFCILYYYAQ